MGKVIHKQIETTSAYVFFSLLDTTTTSRLQDDCKKVSLRIWWRRSFPLLIVWMRRYAPHPLPGNKNENQGDVFLLDILNLFLVDFLVYIVYCGVNLEYFRRKVFCCLMMMKFIGQQLLVQTFSSTRHLTRILDILLEYLTSNSYIYST